MWSVTAPTPPFATTPRQPVAAALRRRTWGGCGLSSAQRLGLDPHQRRARGCDCGVDALTHSDSRLTARRCAPQSTVLACQRRWHGDRRSLSRPILLTKSHDGAATIRIPTGASTACRFCVSRGGVHRRRATNAVSWGTTGNQLGPSGCLTSGRANRNPLWTSTWRCTVERLVRFWICLPRQYVCCLLLLVQRSKPGWRGPSKPAAVVAASNDR